MRVAQQSKYVRLIWLGALYLQPELATSAAERLGFNRHGLAGGTASPLSLLGTLCGRIGGPVAKPDPRFGLRLLGVACRRLSAGAGARPGSGASRAQAA